MSLEAVVEEIREEAEVEAEEIREVAEAEAAEIREEAEVEAEEIREEARQRADREAEAEREQAVSSANLEAKQRRLEARRDALSEVRSAVEAAIAGIEGDQRRELTAALLGAAAEEFDEGPVRVYGRADDAELLEELLVDYADFEHAGEYDCLGGVVCESDVSRVRVNNTFDSVLESVWDDQLREVSAILFEED
jgi:V/A-type H+-transporting ATPase subunit E